MKKIYSLILFIVIASEAKQSLAQTNVYHSFKDTNVVWNQTYSYVTTSFPPVGVQCPHTLLLSGDTVISNITYKKILSSGYCYAQSTCCFHYNQYAGAIRQDSLQRKVYFYKDSSITDTLLYDFNLSVGDTLPDCYTNNSSLVLNYVSSIDSILIGATYRRQYHISIKGSTNTLDSNYAQLIEGVGSTFGLYSLLSGPPFEGGYILNCFVENNAVVYTNPWVGSCDLTVGMDNNSDETRIKIYPNPSTGIFTINSSEKLQFSVYDVFGRDVYQSTNPSANQSALNLSSEPKGIYFVRLKSGDKIITKKIVLQ